MASRVALTRAMYASFQHAAAADSPTRTYIATTLTTYYC